VFAALDALPTHQPVQRATGAVHAAAACAADGAIRLVREDVGRHNALDKLVGAMARGEMEWDGGFALVTSRLSFEMVEKAVLACCPTLAAISAPTGLAVERAKAAGLNLIALARADSYLLA
jgi:FdhD protein